MCQSCSTSQTCPELKQQAADRSLTTGAFLAKALWESSREARQCSQIEGLFI